MYAGRCRSVLGTVRASLTLGVAVGAHEEALVRVLAVRLQPQLAHAARVHRLLLLHARVRRFRVTAALRFCYLFPLQNTINS